MTTMGVRVSRVFFTPATSGGGFTLIEILVTLAVLSIGLTGLAAMNVLSVRKNHDSHLRSLAIMQARQMASRMYANPAGVNAGGYDSIVAITQASPNCLDKSGTTAAATGSINCNAMDMANFDAYEWLSSTARLLPGGKGSVTRKTDDSGLPHCMSATANVNSIDTGVYTIAVSWEESVSQEVNDSNVVSKCFNFQLKPLP